MFRNIIDTGPKWNQTWNGWKCMHIDLYFSLRECDGKLVIFGQKKLVTTKEQKEPEYLHFEIISLI